MHTRPGFRSFTVELVPPDYGNAGYYGCKYDATKMVLAIFAIMMSGEGYSMADASARARPSGAVWAMSTDSMMRWSQRSRS